MNIYLGNLSTDEIELRAGVDFPKELKDFMKSTHQECATGIASGKWHCFDMPFLLLCGDMDTAKTIYSHIEHLSKAFKVPMQIGVQQ